MAKGLIDLIIDSILDDEWKGKYGEKLTARELKLVQLFGRKGKILRNIYLPKDDGGTSELDVVFITQKGIFIFESKNYSGWIFGDEKSMNWTAMLPNKQKNSFYNPIKQNRTHLKWMKHFAGEDVPLFSIIVFSERCELKKVTVYSEDVKVIKRDRTYATVRDIWDKSPDAVSKEKIDELYVNLKELTNVDAAVKLAHIESIEKKYKKNAESTNEIVEADNENAAVEANNENVVVEANNKNDVVENDDKNGAVEVDISDSVQTDENAPDLVCPKCGNKLVLRVAKKGANAGKRFYGCSAFPKCRYIKNVN